jgi:hypothetical protein
MYYRMLGLRVRDAASAGFFSTPYLAQATYWSAWTMINIFGPSYSGLQIRGVQEVRAVHPEWGETHTPYFTLERNAI